MEFLAIIVVLIVLSLPVGAILGLLAFLRVRRLEQRLYFLERKVNAQQRESSTRSTSEPSQQYITQPVSAPESKMPSEPEEKRKASEFPPQIPLEKQEVQKSPLDSSPPKVSKVEKAKEAMSLEMALGSKWLNWVGIVLVIFSLAFFLKYAYDNNWIGPLGRVCIGTIAGIASLVIGEQARRKGYNILFHTLSGGGIAIFYVCIFFSFQVYELINPSIAFTLSVLVTALAVALAVVHDTWILCLIGQLGGFLSPFLFSAGGNHPVALFTYITILDLIAMGCAFFKQWREVNVMAFVGTACVYFTWRVSKFYDDSQLMIALGFGTLFYFLFLILPLLRSMIKRVPATSESFRLIILVIFFAFVNYYFLLIDDHRTALGFVVLGQAAILLGIYRIWIQRCQEDRRTTGSLLVAALVLVTVALPIHLQFYGLPIAWGLEAVLFAYVGLRFEHKTMQAFSFLALILAAAALLARLPLHELEFIPVLNRPFGSWCVVIAAGFASAYFQNKNDILKNEPWKYIPAVSLLAAIFLLCTLLHNEVFTYWWVQEDQLGTKTTHLLQDTSLIILWSLIPLVFVELIRRKGFTICLPLAYIAYGVGLLVVIVAFLHEWPHHAIPFFFHPYLARLVFAGSMAYGVYQFRRLEFPQSVSALKHTFCTAQEVVIHFLLVIFTTIEIISWTNSFESLSPMHQHGFISSLWSLYALGLIFWGLKSRKKYRRILGFFLFGITIFKIFILDMSVVQPVFRILSFGACGILLIVAGYVYQRYAKLLLEEDEEVSRYDKEA